MVIILASFPQNADKKQPGVKPLAQPVHARLQQKTPKPGESKHVYLKKSGSFVLHCRMHMVSLILLVWKKPNLEYGFYFLNFLENETEHQLGI